MHQRPHATQNNLHFFAREAYQNISQRFRNQKLFYCPKRLRIKIVTSELGKEKLNRKIYAFGVSRKGQLNVRAENCQNAL